MTFLRHKAAPFFWFVLGAFFLYFPILTAPVYLDDGPYVFGSAFLRSPSAVFWPALLSPQYFQATAERTWQPLVTALHRLSVDAPLLLRALSILLHALCAWLVFRLGEGFWRSRRAGLFAGALFLAFPLHAEAVFFASFKGHLLAAAAVLACLLAWRAGRRALSVTALALGLLGKETALCAGPLLFFHAVFLERLRPAAAARRLAPHAALAAGYLFVRFGLLMPPPDLLVPAAPRPAAAFAWFLGALAWPPAPSLFRALPPGDAWIFLLLAPYAAALWVWRREPTRLFFLLWIFAALLPFLHLISFAAKSPTADRYLYLAAAGVCLPLGRLADGRARARAAGVALALLWGWAATKRAWLYRDVPALAAASVKAAPSSAAARLFQAETLLLRAEPAEPAGAAAAAAAAARLEPRDPQNWTWLGLSRVAAKQDGAEDAFRRALALQETPQARANLGALLEDIGRSAQALAEYDRAAALAPEWEKPRRLAADLRARLKSP